MKKKKKFVPPLTQGYCSYPSGTQNSESAVYITPLSTQGVPLEDVIDTNIETPKLNWLKSANNVDEGGF